MSGWVLRAVCSLEVSAEVDWTCEPHAPGHASGNADGEGLLSLGGVPSCGGVKLPGWS